MASLFNFTTLDIPVQSTEAKSFGPKSTTKYRLTSTFDVVSENMAFAMMSGTILLQKQTSSSTKINLILKPDDSVNFKLPIKYVIYRGLKLSDFLNSSNLTATSTHVKTSGTELLDAIQAIQLSRAPNDAIPVEALFGYNLAPSTDQNIDNFFYATAAPNSQLFSVEGGIALGRFSNGGAGIEIVLKNPEYFPDVQMVRKGLYEINIPTQSSQETKWKQEQVRHFVDPAAFYGLHQDITDGIGYRDSSGESKKADTNTDIYENVLLPFATKNKIYLDIRNENGYSYNYYNNYVGTGTDANKELKIAALPGSMAPMEYYTLGWPIHIVTGVATSPTEDFNTFYGALRINDNEKPLLAGDAKMLPQATAPNEEQAIKFLDESFLLPSPVTSPLPEFTEAFKLNVPNYIGQNSHNQIATIISLKYIKQIRLNDQADTFPVEKASDNLFGPILTQIPWDSADAIQWIGSNHYKYYDGLNQGFAFVNRVQNITALGSSPSQNTIKIGIDISSEITDKVKIENTSNPVNAGEYHVKGVQATGSSETTITVRESFPSSLQTGDTLKLKLEIAVTIDYLNKKLIAKGINLTNEPGFVVGEYIRLYTKKGDTPLRYTISAVSFASGNTEITVSENIDKEGYGAIMETGIVAETDVNEGSNPPDGDRVILYAAPQYYFQKTGIKDTSFFNYKGATHNGKSFLSTLKERIPGFEIEKFSLRPEGESPVATLSYPDSTVTKENLLILGLAKSEFESLKTAALASLSIFHLQMIKLKPQGNRKRDLDYETYYKYHAVVTGLDANGIYAEAVPSNPVVVYSRDGLIFTSQEYVGHTEVKQIVIEEALNEFLTNNLFDGFDEIHKNYPLIEKLYTPEEYGELCPDPVNPESSDSRRWLRKNLNLKFSSNYHLLNIDDGLEGIVQIIQNFKSELNTLSSGDLFSFESLCVAYGKKILQRAEKIIRVETITKTYNEGAMSKTFSTFNKDGIIYIARLKMQVILKYHPVVINISTSERISLSVVFEKVSRGLLPSIETYPDFTTYRDDNYDEQTAPIDVKKVLISGFDPFGAGFDIDGHNSNPSGNIALFLTHEKTEDNLLVKGVTFPVRYHEFDAGWIEQFFEPFINNPGIKMIVTISYGVDGDKFGFEIERFAAYVRNKYLSDNNKIFAPNTEFFYSDDKPEFIETKLPYSSTNGMEISDEVGFDQKAEFALYDGQVKIQEIRIPVDFNVDISLYNNTLPLPPLIAAPDLSIVPGTTANRIKAMRGSGGYYLSNEIFYRVSYLRYFSLEPEKYTGHMHVGYLNENIHPNHLNRSHMITIFKESISKAF